MKAKARMTKDKNENGTIVVTLFVENVEQNSDVENKLKELGYLYIGFGLYKATANNADQLNAIRIPVIEMAKSGKIEM